MFARLLIALTAIVLWAAPRTPVPAVESKPHGCSVPGLTGEVQCATFPVWENRDRKTGRKIGLNIIILPAFDRSKKDPDPLFLFHGGPGAAATDLTGYPLARMARQHRDIVLVDQRGTGSSNPLDCDIYGYPEDLQKVVGETFPTDALRACRERLEKIADLRMYTTAPSVDDIDDVREWLGYKKINIWGGSYGTVAAQVYLRRHGANVRSAVLAATAPVDELIPLHHAWAGQRAVDEIFAKCHADAACENAYPHLREDFQSMFDRVRKGVDVEVRDRTGQAVKVRPSLSAFADALRHSLYGDDGATFPLKIHQAAQGNLAPILQTAITAEIALKRQLAMGMNLSVTCAEDVPFISDAMMEKETANTFIGDLRVKEQRAACDIWVRGPVPADVHELIHTNVPVLLLAGGRDSVTPPIFAERAAKYMTNSTRVLFPESSHGNWGQCGNQIQADFIDRGTANGLQTSCAAQQKPTKFVLAP